MPGVYRLKRRAEAGGNALATAFRRYRRASDADHWARDDVFAPQWDDRVRLMASRIPAGAAVIDVGAGTQQLRSELPEGSTYIPVDLVARTPDTVVCDFNEDAVYPDLAADWVVASGVIEYLHDVPLFLKWVSASAPQAVVSYVVTEGPFESRLRRRSLRWVNDFDSESVVGLLEEAGMTVRDTQPYQDQLLIWAGR